jgi:integrase
VDNGLWLTDDHSTLNYMPTTCHFGVGFAMKNTVLRENWPKIRRVKMRGVPFFQVDARKLGTSGKRETFSSLGEAEKRAQELETLYDVSGKEGLDFPPDLRVQALTAQKLLEPFQGKTIVQAAEHYREYLEGLGMKEASALVTALADEWFNEKSSGKYKVLRAETLKGIKQTRDNLKTLFSHQRILAITTTDIQNHLDTLQVGLQRKYNVNNLFSQFFNWAIKHEHISSNPCDKIEIYIASKEVEIFTPTKAEELLRLLAAKYPQYVLYHALGLFAGLRPEESQYLEWSQIHLDERTITVLAETSKIKETRNVHIEDTLHSWLVAYKPNEPHGYITPQVNFKNYNLQIHIAAGYRGTLAKKENGKITRTLHNPDKAGWPVDVLRHSYGSYWLSKHGNRAQLAENMGNSIQIIKKHYKRVVSKSATEAFWSILPASTASTTTAVPTKHGARRKQAERLAAAMAREPAPTE